MVAVSVIVINFNGERLLDDCLSSLENQIYRDYEVILVDNGSSDNSVAKAYHLMPQIRVLRLTHNTGWARGNNIGIETAKGQHIVLLNNDTQVNGNFLLELVRAVESDDRIGMVAPKILNFFERERIDSVGGLLMCRDGIAQGRGRGELDRGQYDRRSQALIPSGCAALYRKKMLDEVGYFDDHFFAYCEDSDLGLRGLWAGWKTVSAPNAIVFHKYSATSSSYSPLKLYLVERNHFFVALKNFPLPMLLSLPLWTLYRYGLMICALLSGRGKGNAKVEEESLALLKALIKGQAEAWFYAVQNLRNRTKIKRLSSRQFLQLLKESRLSQWRMISNS